MVRDVGEQGLRVILIQAMGAAKSVRVQLDRLAQLRRQLQQQQPRSPGPGAADDAAAVKAIAAGLFHVYYRGLEYASRYLVSLFNIAMENHADLDDLNPAFTVIPNEQLYAVLRAQRLPARPATQSQAFARVEAAFNALRLPEDHHLPRCIELLVGERPPSVTGKPLPPISMTSYTEDPVAAAYEHLAKNGMPKTDLSIEAPTAAAADVEPPQAPCSVDLDQALTYLHRACSLTSLALKHIDKAVAFFSSYFDPEELDKIAETADRYTFIPDPKEFNIRESNTSPSDRGGCQAIDGAGSSCI